jgi:hypothetical protein
MQASFLAEFERTGASVMAFSSPATITDGISSYHQGEMVSRELAPMVSAMDRNKRGDG